MPQKKYLIILLAVCFAFKSKAQLLTNKNWGFNVGVILCDGNKFQRIGLTFQSYYIYNFAQVNAELRIYHNMLNLGPSDQYGEITGSAGLVCGYGQKLDGHNPFLSSISNQTGYANSVGYSYNVYCPRKMQTKQQTGTIALQFKDFSVISENDILGHTFYDRFRTGAILLQYQYQNKYQFAVNCTMWTGQMGNRMMGNPHFPAGYMDTTGGKYTHYSSGLLSLQAKAYMDYGQNVQANVGMDAEQVRNFVQNKLIHDMVFIPRSWFKRNNAYIPMVDSEGNQYLYKDGQKIRGVEPYINVFTNAALFY
ncbi:MAG: polymorphic toxin type 23 domain-containing protein [Bacteroidia bacterium]